MKVMKVRLLALTFGFILAAGGAWAGPTPGGADSDSDGVENAFDNCTAASNTSQTDTDHNGCGDTCTRLCNWNVPADGVVGVPDFLVLGMNFGMTGVVPGTLGDCAGAPVTNAPDGAVGIPDFLQLGMTFGQSNGASGITNAQCTPSTCLCTPQ